jgi:hypothetical protein
LWFGLGRKLPLKIVEKNGEWNLIVKTREEKEPTKFKMSELKSDKFVCVNDTIDFPKRIEYWKNGEKINATVSGGDLTIPFEFERMK